MELPDHIHKGYNTMNKFCRGCATTENCMLRIQLHFANCPCVKCVIKSMCKDHCTDMIKYYRKKVVINPDFKPERQTKFRRKKK